LLADDGLSSNGTFVNGQRIVARRRLTDGDAIRVGATVILFRNRAPRRHRPYGPQLGSRSTS